MLIFRKSVGFVGGHGLMMFDKVVLTLKDSFITLYSL